MIRQLIKIKIWQRRACFGPVVALVLLNGCVVSPQFPFAHSRERVVVEKPPQVIRAEQPPVAESVMKSAADGVPPAPERSHTAVVEKDVVARNRGLAADSGKICAPLADIRKTVEEDDEKAPAPEPEQIDSDFVARRLTHYRQKITVWNKLAGGLVGLDMGSSWPEGWYGCVQKLEMVFAGYRRLQKAESGSGAGAVSAKPLTAYQRDVEYQESGCDEIMAASQKKVAGRLAGFREVAVQQAERLVRQYLEQGRNEEAGRAYENFIGIYGAEAAADELKIMYGRALMRQGRLDAALTFLADTWAKETARPGGTPPVTNDLGIIYADLLMVNNKSAAARNIYKKLALVFDADNARELWVKNQLRILEKTADSGLPMDYIGVLRSYYRFNGRDMPEDLTTSLAAIKKTEITALAANAEIIHQEMATVIKQRIDRQLVKIDELIEGREFDQARAVAAKLLSSADTDDNNAGLAAQSRIDEAAAAARQARQQFDKQRADSQWQTAVDLLDRRDYRAAIGAFGKLLTGAYADEARSKMAEAANMAAVETRRQAASLFFKARKTSDPQLKKQLMMQSRAMLLQLINDYPDVDIIDKIRRNLQVLDEQLAGMQAVYEN